MCIPTPNTGQLNPLFHTFGEFRLIVNRIVARQSTDWLAANAQFSPNEVPPVYITVIVMVMDSSSMDGALRPVQTHVTLMGSTIDLFDGH